MVDLPTENIRIVGAECRINCYYPAFGATSASALRNGGQHYIVVSAGQYSWVLTKLGLQAHALSNEPKQFAHSNNFIVVEVGLSAKPLKNKVAKDSVAAFLLLALKGRFIYVAGGHHSAALRRI